MRCSIQSLLMPMILLSILNVAYTFLVVVVLQSWLLTWWIDRRFPFRLVPLWAFCLVSLGIGALSLYYLRKVEYQPKLGCDKFNIFLIYGTMGLFVWILIAISLTHTYYIGDFNVWSVLEAVFSGKVPTPFVEVPLESVDVFPTLGDSLFIAYFLSFFFMYVANLRGLRVNLTSQTGVIGRNRIVNQFLIRSEDAIDETLNEVTPVDETTKVADTVDFGEFSDYAQPQAPINTTRRRQHHLTERGEGLQWEVDNVECEQEAKTNPIQEELLKRRLALIEARERVKNIIHNLTS